MFISVPGETRFDPRKAMSVACPDHPNAAVETQHDESFDGSRLLASTSWVCTECRYAIEPEETT